MAHPWGYGRLEIPMPRWLGSVTDRRANIAAFATAIPFVGDAAQANAGYFQHGCGACQGAAGDIDPVDAPAAWLDGASRADAAPPLLIGPAPFFPLRVRSAIALALVAPRFQLTLGRADRAGCATARTLHN